MHTLLYLKWITNKVCIAQGTLPTVTWQPGWEGNWGRTDACICMAESYCCSFKNITTSLTGYTSIQNKKFKKKKSCDSSGHSQNAKCPLSWSDPSLLNHATRSSNFRQTEGPGREGCAPEKGGVGAGREDARGPG